MLNQVKIGLNRLQLIREEKKEKRSKWVKIDYIEENQVKYVKITQNSLKQVKIGYIWFILVQIS